MALLARNTDRDWQILGARAPYWAVGSVPHYEGGQALEGERRAWFFASGEQDVAHFRDVLERRLGVPARIGAALDFGCGVGRLLIPMRARAARAVGVDVADSMRDLARRHLAEAGFADVALAASLDEAAAHGPFDWVSSYIVLQHIPPARGYALIGRLAALTAPGGALSLHVTTGRDAALKARGPARAAWRWLRGRFTPAGQVTMYDYDLSRVQGILRRAGCGEPVLEKVDHGGHHGFLIYCRKV